MTKQTLLTTGYSGHDPASFLALLNAHQIQMVVDVRRNPMSRKQGFSKTRLAAFLGENGVAYAHLKELGVPQNLRRKLKAGTCSLGFRKYLKKQTAVLDEVYNLAQSQRVCLLCVEQCPDECHRSVVAEEDAARNGRTVEVLHI